METNFFWGLLDLSLRGTNGNIDAQLSRLEALVEVLPADQAATFDRMFRRVCLSAMRSSFAGDAPHVLQ